MHNNLIQIQVKDPLNELAIVILAVILMFLFLIVIGAVIVIRYQKKKYRYKQDLLELQKENEAAILRSQLEVQEQTFNAISQEIHDNVGQILSLAKVELNIAQTLLADPMGILRSSKENIGRAMNDLRDIAKSLSSDRISQLDLRQAIQQEGERINKTKFIRCSVETIGEPGTISSSKKLVTFRVVQEILNNTLKHSKAAHVLIRTQFEQRSFCITITDDGKGFEVDLQRSTGLGLQNITKRVGLIGGTISIQSILEQGTTLQINIPFD